MNTPIKLTLLIKHTLVYGVALASLYLILQWLYLQFLISYYSPDFFIAAIAIIFTGLGVWISINLIKPKTETRIIEREIDLGTSSLTPSEFDSSISQKALIDFGLSSRELEVLKLIAQGMTNQEIASTLFVSLNTVKTHSSNLFIKLNVNRRTQAVAKAKELGLFI